MTGRGFLESLGSMLEARAGVEKLREAVLDLAVRGMLLPQMGTNIYDDAGKSKSVPFRSHAAWEWKALVELGITQTGSTPSTKISAYWGADVPFVTPGDIDEPMVRAPAKHLSTAGAAQARIVPANSVLMVCIGGSLGKVGYVDSPVTCNQQINAFTPSPQSGLDSRFACLALRSPRFKREAWTRAGQGTLPIISKSKWEQIPIPVPPLAEQKRIVAKVDQLMALCDDLEAKQTKQRDLATQSTRSALTALTTAENADDLAAAWRRVAKNFRDVLGDADGILALKDAVLALAVRGQIENAAPGDESIEHVADRLSRARDAWAAKARGNHDAFPEVEDAPFEVARWRWIRLGNLAEIVGGVPKGRKLAGRQVSSFPYLRVANVQRGFLDLTVMKELEIPREELPRYRLLPNDVLFTEGGDWDKLGRSAVWPGEIDPCIHQNHIFRARLLTKDIDPRWVSMFCNSPVGRAYFEDAAKQTTNLATINMTELRHCPIPVPPPQERRRILDRLHKITSLLDDLEAKLRKQEETATRLAESLAAAVAA